MTIKVMIVDDSSIVRQVMHEVLSKEADIEVIATAVDPIFAWEKMALAWPDVIVLDIEMPRMDGITFLKKIMEERPTPVVICSKLTENNAALSAQAFAAGALSVINKPAIGVKNYIQDSSADLLTAIRTAAQAKISSLKTTTELINNKTITPNKPSNSKKISKLTIKSLFKRVKKAAFLTLETTPNNSPKTRGRVSPKLNADEILPPPSLSASIPKTEKLIVIGTSTGGTQALEIILRQLKPNCAGIAIVQHMPEKFTDSFAQRLNGLCAIEVREAINNDPIRPGVALIAPGGKHMLIRRKQTQYFVEIRDGPLVCRHRPSVDVLFRSAASSAGKNAVGYILTGMGDDGARGMKELADAGAMTYAQNEESCVVFGMPKEAIAHGGVQEIIALEHVATSISRYR